MRNFPLTLLLFLFLASTLVHSKELPRVQPAEVGMSAEGLAKIDGAVNKLIKDKKLAGGIVLVARNGKIPYFKAFGKKSIEDNTPVTEDTIFRIYSMTKPIVSVATMILIEKGKMELDDPVSKYMPELGKLKVYNKEKNVDSKRDMTVRDLLRHTSGVTYGFLGGPVGWMYYKEDISNKKHNLKTFITKLSKLPLVCSPGEKWEYSMSTDVLGALVEVVSKKKLDAFLKENIFDPLDMKDTGFYVPKEKQARFADLYNSDDKGGLKRGDPANSSSYLKNPAFLSGGGGLVSTARDYSRFLQMMVGKGKFGKRILKKKTIRQMTKNQLPDHIPSIAFGKEIRDGIGFGLGFNVVYQKSKFAPYAAVGEYGWGGAASTHFWVSPKDKLFVITLEQTMPYNWNMEIGVKQIIYDAIVEK